MNKQLVKLENEQENNNNNKMYLNLHRIYNRQDDWLINLSGEIINDNVTDILRLGEGLIFSSIFLSKNSDIVFKYLKDIESRI